MVGFTQATIMGGNKTDPNSAYSLTVTPITGTAAGAKTTTQYKFITNAGSWVSWNDFDQFRILSNGYLFATADLPAKGTGTGGSTSTGSSSTSKNSASSLSLSLTTAALFAAAAIQYF